MTTNSTAASKVGRPSQGKNSGAFKFRVTSELREKLEKEAGRLGRPISEVIERRLEDSFANDRRQQHRSDGLKLALRYVERTWEFLEERISNQWASHDSGKAAMREAMLEILDFAFPAVASEEMNAADRKELDELRHIVSETVGWITWRTGDQRKNFTENKLLQAASAPISAVEAHLRWVKSEMAAE